jgi:quercetin dioxygenase-like cupin family protein
MPFYRFDAIPAQSLTPHLSTARGPVISGECMYFCLVRKEAGTGSQLHYHPNELLIFPLTGALDAIIGGEKRVLRPGDFAHAPPYTMHSVKATIDGVAEYLYIKDKTWTVVGLAADEAVPDRAMTLEEVNRLHAAGELERRQVTQGSLAVDERPYTCFYHMTDSLDAVPLSGHHLRCVGGEHLLFGLLDVPARRASFDLLDLLPEGNAAWRESQHEFFVYVLDGAPAIRLESEERALRAGDIVQVPRNACCLWRNPGTGAARLAFACSTPELERRLDTMLQAEGEWARLNVLPD